VPAFAAPKISAAQSAPKGEAPTAMDTADAIEAAQSGAITEAELRQMLVGKALYLRGGYLDNSLTFSENGHLIGHSPQGSFTLCAIEIERVHLTKHKVFLEGSRYGLHFVGQLAYEDPSKAVDRVRITPKKKVLKITIDREIVVKPKKKKDPKAEKDKATVMPSTAHGAAPAATTPAPTVPVTATPAAAPEPEELSPADQLKASIAAAPDEERPADPNSVTTTLYAAHATKVLRDALDQIFAQAFDDGMMAAMPDFWKLYYQAVADKVDYRPKDPSIYRQNTVDQKARLLTNFEPDSNEFAQAAAVAGMALYHTVIGPDGKAGEIAVARPIGFGLDENAVAAIRKASFQPAMKDGKPVPVLLDLVVQFRIFSKRTAVHLDSAPADKPAETVLPGPYSVPR
jgi:TonB family protein